MFLVTSLDPYTVSLEDLGLLFILMTCIMFIGLPFDILIAFGIAAAVSSLTCPYYARLLFYCALTVFDYPGSNT